MNKNRYMKQRVKHALERGLFHKEDKLISINGRGRFGDFLFPHIKGWEEIGQRGKGASNEDQCALGDYPKLSLQRY